MRLGIIGAGVAGLAAARALRLARPDIEIIVYEKSRGVGGRAATRRVAGYSFDHGAQYLKSPTSDVTHLVTQTFASTSPLDIVPPVWVFDGAGTVSEGDPLQNDEAKWTWPHGITTLSKALGAGIEVAFGARVGQLKLLAGGGFALIDVDGNQLSTVDAVLLTAPSSQSAEIVAASDLAADVQQALLNELNKVTYRRCLSLTFAYERQPNVPWYAIVNNDRAHPISWLACEHAKPGRVSDGTGLLIAQLAPGPSVTHYDEAQAGTFEQLDAAPAYIAETHQQIAQLLGEDLGAPRWVNLQRWRYALPDGRADFDTLNATSSGLFFAGDFTAGQGRVHLAIEEGWRVAKVIAGRL